MPIAALVTDLIFSTKISSTANALRVPLRIARTAEAVLQHLGDRPGTAIVDLNAAGVDPVAVIRTLKGHAPAPHVIAFLSHVQTELAAAAKEAGADQVLPRSAFTAQLPDLIKKAAASI